MLNLLRSPLVAEWASASAVVLVSALVGNQARDGMSPVQWAGGLAAILGAIGWAVIVRVWREETAAN
jgi:hypothetical protein